METLASISHFAGVDERVLAGDDVRLSPFSRNVRPFLGRLFTRKGIGKYKNFATGASELITGLMHKDGTPVRILTSKVEYWNGAMWADITGTALSGNGQMRPQGVNIDGHLIFTIEGINRPRKWSGSGTTAPIANNTAPFGKAIGAYKGFVFLGNVSDSGSFTDLPLGKVTVRYSDDWDNDWSLCDGNELILDETPGEILAFATVGEDLLAFKSDGIVRIRAVGGQVRFEQKLLPFDHGLLAPMSVATVKNTGAVFLATDGQLYIANGNGVVKLPEAFGKTLNRAFPRLSYAVGVLDSLRNSYLLFYDDTNSDQLDAAIEFNLETKAFSKHEIGPGFLRGVSLPAPSSAVLLSSSLLVYEWEASSASDDGQRIFWQYTSPWLTDRTRSKIVRNIELVFSKLASGRVEIELGADFRETFFWKKSYPLRGLVGESDVVITYELPDALSCRVCRVRISFFPESTSQIELLSLTVNGDMLSRQERIQEDITSWLAA